MAEETYFQQVLKPGQAKGYLGDGKVVDSLLRNFAFRILSADHQDDNALATAVDQGSRLLAKVLLGQDKNYPGPKWNTPGQIDAYVAKHAGIQSNDPVERVAGGLVRMVTELFELSGKISNEQLVQEQWQDTTGEVIQKYVRMFLGVPEDGGVSNGMLHKPINRLPK